MIITDTSANGRRSALSVPDDAPQATWPGGVLVGPPDLSGLGLPEEVTTRLHNELFHRGLLRRADVRFRRADVVAALQAALKVDAQLIIDIYEAEGN